MLKLLTTDTTGFRSLAALTTPPPLCPLEAGLLFEGPQVHHICFSLVYPGNM